MAVGKVNVGGKYRKGSELYFQDLGFLEPPIIDSNTPNVASPILLEISNDNYLYYGSRPSANFNSFVKTDLSGNPIATIATSLYGINTWGYFYSRPLNKFVLSRWNSATSQIIVDIVDENLVIESTVSVQIPIASNFLRDVFMDSNGEYVYLVQTDGNNTYFIKVDIATGVKVYQNSISTSGSFLTANISVDGNRLYVVRQIGGNTGQLTIEIRSSTDFSIIATTTTTAFGPNFKIVTDSVTENVFYVLNNHFVNKIVFDSASNSITRIYTKAIYRFIDITLIERLTFNNKYNLGCVYMSGVLVLFDTNTGDTVFMNKRSSTDLLIQTTVTNDDKLLRQWVNYRSDSNNRHTDIMPYVITLP